MFPQGTGGGGSLQLDRTLSRKKKGGRIRKKDSEKSDLTGEKKISGLGVLQRTKGRKTLTRSKRKVITKKRVKQRGEKF